MREAGERLTVFEKWEMPSSSSTLTLTHVKLVEKRDSINQTTLFPSTWDIERINNLKV